MSTNKKNRETLHFLESLAGGPLTLGRLLFSIRQGEELTQTDFADMLDISKQNLCHIERGRRVVSPRMAADFAMKLGYSEQQFIQLAIQDELERDGLNYTVTLSEAA